MTVLICQFTGKERDAETGLDYFGARYLSGAQGRFTSPDWVEAPEPVPYSKLDNPQTLNLYGYVLNNPLSQKDDDGHEIIYADGLKNSQLGQTILPGRNRADSTFPRDTAPGVLAHAGGRGV